MKRIYVLITCTDTVEDIFVGVFDNVEELKREMRGFDSGYNLVRVYDITENGTMVERGTARYTEAFVLNDTVLFELY